MIGPTVGVDEAVAMEAERERQMSALEARMLAGAEVPALAARLRESLVCEDGWGDGMVAVPRETLRAYLDATTSASGHSGTPRPDLARETRADSATEGATA